MSELSELMADAARAARPRPWPADLLFAQGLHPADQALPRRLPLLHLRRAAARRAQPAYLSPEEVLAIARAGAGGRLHARRCSRWATSRSCATARRARRSTRSATRRRSTISPRCARWCCDETGLLPHVNPGVMTRDEIARAARGVGVARASCWRSTSRAAVRARRRRISARPTRSRRCGWRRIAAGRRAAGAVHHRHPDRHRRDARGAHRGAAARMRDLHAQHGHIQEVIVQNFRAKPDTQHGRRAPSRDLDDLLWTIAVARLIFGPDDEHPGAAQPVSPASISGLIAAGINDWGGVSPVTPDHVNPEAPWPQLDALARRQRRAGKVLVERLAGLSGLRRASPSAGSRPTVRDAGAAHERRRRACARDDDWAPGDDRAAAGAARSLLRDGRSGDRAHRRSRDRRRAPRRSRDRAAVRGARRRLSRMYARRPTRCARRSAATSSATSSTATSTTPTSATSAASFCAFSKGKHARGPARHALRPRRSTRSSRRARRSLGARRHRGLPAGRHPSRLHRRDLSRDLPRHQGGGAGHAHPRLLAAGGDAGRGDARPAARATSSRGCKRRRARHACPAPRPKSSTTRCARIICPDKVNTAQWLDVHATPRTASACAPPRPSCSATSSGRVHWARHLLRAARPAGARPAASPSSCRCPSCTWRRRSICKGRARTRADLPRGGADARGRAAGAASARSPTSRPRG